MRRAAILIALLLILSAGCLEQRSYPGVDREHLLSEQSTDIDGDGSADFILYTFSPETNSEAGRTVQRQIAVAVSTTGTYSGFNTFTELDALDADTRLEDFSESVDGEETACSQALGTRNVQCIDINTCAKLCSSNSVRCKKMVTNYNDIVGGSIMSYASDMREVDTLVYNARKDIFSLNSLGVNAKNIYLNQLRDAVAKIAEVYANPIYSKQEVQMCSSGDFGIADLVYAADAVGNYTIENQSYTYVVMVTVKESGEREYLGKGFETIAIQDSVPSGIISGGDELSSPLEIITTDGATTLIDWGPAEPVEETMLVYEFTSTTPPERVAGGYNSPKLTVKGMNLEVLAPLNMLFLMVLGATGNYYAAMGISLGITLVVLFIVYNLLIVFVFVLRAMASGGAPIVGVRKALGKTEIRWKTDVVVAVVLLGVGLYSAVFMAVSPSPPTSILDVDALNFMALEWWGLGGLTAIFLGVILSYTTIENLTKIMLLERAYGVAIKEEKEDFLAKVEHLKARLQELRELISTAAEQEFEVGDESDIVTSVKADRISEVSRKMTTRTKRIIDEDLTKVDRAIGRIKERMLLADENWPKWSGMMDSLLAEHNEIRTSSLHSIPSSLRAYALGRYVKENKEIGVAFEGDVVKKRKVSIDKVIGRMIDDGHLTGLVVMKDDTLVMSQMAHGSATVPSVLGIKLKYYINSLAKNMGQGEPTSFASVGSKTVLVLMKDNDMRSLLFVNKAKFKEAIEEWKVKSKGLMG